MATGNKESNGVASWAQCCFQMWKKMWASWCSHWSQRPTHTRFADHLKILKPLFRREPSIDLQLNATKAREKNIKKPAESCVQLSQNLPHALYKESSQKYPHWEPWTTKPCGTPPSHAHRRAFTSYELKLRLHFRSSSQIINPLQRKMFLYNWSIVGWIGVTGQDFKSWSVCK